MLTWFTFICSLLADFISIIMFLTRVFYMIFRLKKSIYKKKLLILLFRYIKFLIIINLLKIMAKIKQGIFGAISGKIGNLVGSSWKGIAIMKIKAASVSNPKTAGQVAQRTNFKNAVQFASIILSAIIIPLWNRFSVQMSGFNAFVQKNVGLFALSIPSPLSSLIISMGKIGATVISGVIATTANKSIQVSWNDDSGSENRLTSDFAYMVVINEEQMTVQGFDTQTSRYNFSLTCVMDNQPLSGEHLSVYLSFRRTDGTMVSNSSYFRFAVA